MGALLADLRQTLRGMRKTPGLVLVVLLTLALGIGMNGAIFSVFDAVILEPLEYPRPEQLVLVTSQFPTMGFERFWIDPPEYMEYRQWTESLASVGAYRATEFSLVGAEQPIQVRGAVASASLFRVLGVAPLRGRTYNEAEDAPGGAPVIVISHQLWQRAFGGEESVVGRSVTLDGEPVTVVGIMPPGFDIEENRVEVWQPLGLGTEDMNRRGNHFLFLAGRLREGTTLEQARAELALLVAGWQERSGGGHTPSTEGHPFQMRPLHEEVVGDTRPALFALLGAVGFVLLIACANVANLLLARSEARQKEMAIRSAMGASRLRLVRQLLTESVVLAVLGGAIGVVLAHVGLKLLLAANPESLPRTDDVQLDGTVLLVSLLIAVLTGLLFGLVPALQLSAGGLARVLKEGGGRASAGGAGLQVRRLLVVAEMALAVGLVVGSALMLKSLGALLNVDKGFEAAQLTTFELSLPSSSYPDGLAQSAFHQRLAERLRGVPGIESVAAASGLPPVRDLDANDMEFEGLEQDPKGPAHNIDYWQFTTDDYLEVMGIRLVDGRGFTLADGGVSPPAALVNQHAAEVFWPGQNALGRRLRPDSDESPWLTIVGVVEDVKQGGLDQPVGTKIYFRYDQVATAFGRVPRTMNLVVRSALPQTTLYSTLREQVWALDPALPVAKLRTMDEVVGRSVSRPRFLALLLSIFGALALLLASIGIYGVLSYNVARRGQEMGIRMALGADRGSILGMVLSQGMLLALVGVALGIVGSLGLSRVLASLLFGVSPTDPFTYLWVAGLLVLVALMACAVPALRATRVDPLAVLRYE